MPARVKSSLWLVSVAVAQSAVNRWVVGSNPTRAARPVDPRVQYRTKYAGISQRVRNLKYALPCDELTRDIKIVNSRSLEPERPCRRYGRRKASAYIGDWCNGSMPLSKSVGQGSNPWSPAIFPLLVEQKSAVTSSPYQSDAFEPTADLYMRECWNRQTVKLEVLVFVRACGFKSRLAHQYTSVVQRQNAGLIFRKSLVQIQLEVPFSLFKPLDCAND